MKEPLKLPFVFLFILLCVAALLSVLQILSTWGRSDGLFDLGYVIQELPQAAFDVLIPSVVISTVLLGFRMARRPSSRLLGFLIGLAVGYIVLVNGMIGLSALAGKVRSAPVAARQFLQPRTFLRLGDVVLAPSTVQDGSLGGVLVYDPTLAGQKLSVFPAGTAVPQDGRLTIALTGPNPRRLSGQPLAARQSVFAPDGVTSFFLRDIRTLTGDFERLMRNALPEFFAACFALVFLCAASLALLRLTRWPLVNIMLLLIAVRGYFLLYHVLATRLAPAVSAAVTDPLLARLFPSAAFVILGVLLLLIDVLFIPADRWARREPA